MTNPLNLHVDTRSPIPIRRQLTEQLKHVIESGGLLQNQPLPSIRELAGFPARAASISSMNPVSCFLTVARTISLLLSR